jgi:hypothetical protein
LQEERGRSGAGQAEEEAKEGQSEEGAKEE